MKRILPLAILLTAAIAAAAKPRPLVPDPLAWGQGVKAAMTVLQRAKMAPVYGETHAYREGLQGSPGVDTAEPGIYFVPRKGWTGEAHFAWSTAAVDDRLDRVTFRAEVSAGEARRELAALERRYGPPITDAGPQRLWIRGSASLVASADEDPATKRWSLYINYCLEEKPRTPP